MDDHLPESRESGKKLTADDRPATICSFDRSGPLSQILECGNLELEANVDWTDCPLVEVIEGKQGGVALIKGTRIPAQQIVEEFRLGSSIIEIAENYPSLTRDQIRKLIEFDQAHQGHPVL